MSLSATLNNALSGLTVAQRGLSLTAHNIVNADTEGNARKVALPGTQVLADRGAGVRTGEVARVVDRPLSAEIRRQSNKLGEALVVDGFHERIHERIQEFLGQPGENNDVAFKLGELETAFEALAANPENGAQDRDPQHRRKPERPDRRLRGPDPAPARRCRHRDRDAGRRGQRRTRADHRSQPIKRLSERSFAGALAFRRPRSPASTSTRRCHVSFSCRRATRLRPG